MGSVRVGERCLLLGDVDRVTDGWGRGEEEENEEENVSTILQRSTVPSRFVFNYYRPGLDLRMRGDGAEDDCCHDEDVGGSCSWTDRDCVSMMEIVKSAKEVRRLIRLEKFRNHFV